MATDPDTFRPRDARQRRADIFELASSQQAEHAILGLVLVRPDVLGWLDLRGEHFADLRCATVWEAMQALAKEGTPLDMITLEDQLRRVGRLEAVGGIAYVSKLLAEVPYSSDPASADHWAEILHRKLVTRRVLLLCGAAEEMAQRGLDGGELLDEVLGDLGRVDRDGPMASQDVTLADAVEDELIRIEAGYQTAREPGGPPVMAGLAIGIPDVDHQTGGIPIGTITIVAARPGVGKSSLMFQIMTHIARQTGGGAMLFTNEDRQQTIARIAIASATGVDRARLRHYSELTPIDMVELRNARRDGDDRVSIVHAHGMTGQQIARIVRAERRRKDLRVIGWDYIQNAPSPPGVEKRHEGIEQNLAAMEKLIAEEGLACVVASQLRRADERRGENARPAMSDMKESGAIEQKAKLILALHETPDLVKRHRIEILVLKQNEGAKLLIIEIPFYRAQTRFA